MKKSKLVVTPEGRLIENDLKNCDWATIMGFVDYVGVERFVHTGKKIKELDYRYLNDIRRKK